MPYTPFHKNRFKPEGLEYTGPDPYGTEHSRQQRMDQMELFHQMGAIPSLNVPYTKELNRKISGIVAKPRNSTSPFGIP